MSETLLVATKKGLFTVQRDGDNAKVSGAVRGGGPRVVLRASHGDITVR